MDAEFFTSMQIDAEFLIQCKRMMSFYFNANECWVFTSVQMDAEFVILYKRILSF